jgi:hypothetical protein
VLELDEVVWPELLLDEVLPLVLVEVLPLVLVEPLLDDDVEAVLPPLPLVVLLPQAAPVVMSASAAKPKTIVNLDRMTELPPRLQPRRDDAERTSAAARRSLVGSSHPTLRRVGSAPWSRAALPRRTGCAPRLQEQQRPCIRKLSVIADALSSERPTPP